MRVKEWKVAALFAQRRTLEVYRIVEEAHGRVRILLGVAQHLQEKEVIDGEEFMKVIVQFGIRKVAEKSDETRLISQQRSTA